MYINKEYKKKSIPFGFIKFHNFHYYFYKLIYSKIIINFIQITLISKPKRQFLYI